MQRPAKLAFLVTLVSALGCNDSDGFPECMLDDRIDSAVLRLTGPPTFTSEVVAPGDALSLTIPVDPRALTVTVATRVLPEGQSVWSESVPTEGATTVTVPIVTDLSPGNYSASIVMSGESELFFGTYAPRSGVDNYVLVFERGSCVTEFPLARFTVLPE